MKKNPLYLDKDVFNKLFFNVPKNREKIILALDKMIKGFAYKFIGDKKNKDDIMQDCLIALINILDHKMVKKTKNPWSYFFSSIKNININSTQKSLVKKRRDKKLIDGLTYITKQKDSR